MVEKKSRTYGKSASSMKSSYLTGSKAPRIVVDVTSPKGPVVKSAKDLALDWNPKATRPKVLSKAQERTGFLIDTIGTAAAVARILNVSRSQPLRWSKGEEAPGPEAARLIIDLDYVLARATLLWKPDVAIDWVEGPNSYLEGARPIDVLNERGPDEVLRALDAALV